MADELRHENLTNTVADGTTSSSAGSTFRNNTSGMIHIRDIDYNHDLRTAGPNENVQVEISKSPVMASNVENNVFYTYPQRMVMDTAVALDSGTWTTGYKKYGRGQLTLEPNESLFVNTVKTSGGALRYTFVIGYEFA